MGNLFGEDDKPTLAGKLAAKNYGELVKRQDGPKLSVDEVRAEDLKGRVAFSSYVKEVNEKRVQEGMSPFAATKDHTAGVDDFHVDGKGYLSDFEFYFNKSASHWKTNPAELIRGYVTLNPAQAGEVQRHFVDLVEVLYDSGIDFTAKASGFYGTTERTDNMVFYISPNDQAKAAELMKGFLKDRGIGTGHVRAGLASDQDGLSWAFDPDKTQTQVWQEVAGATTKASFNFYVAARTMPEYLERVALAHENKGDTAQAAIFRKEAERVKEVVGRLNPQV